ncbi:MAG: glycoside hydrolase family 13 protein [Nakamurella sp.]
MTITVPRSAASHGTATHGQGSEKGNVADWWRTAVIYQVYLRSFADDNGDGTGDLAGVRSRLSYLRDLGIDAIWFSPWYLSPLADGGYDVADYRQIDPAFGTLAEAELLIAEARELGIRTIVDIVPNHLSDEHSWFKAALAAGPGSPERERFWFRAGRGNDGNTMPTDWVSSFSGTTWTRTTNPDGTPGEWYLHLFDAKQPDVNWDNPDVRREHEDVLRFWFDRGVAGIRIDSAALLVKDPALPSVPEQPEPGEHPHLDRDELHAIYRSWRSIANEYEEPRVLVAEIWLADSKRFAKYLRSDEIHTAFNFDFMAKSWDPAALRGAIQDTLDSHATVDAPPTWVLSNHDVTRPVTRYGRADSSFSLGDKRFGVPTDLELGSRRARAAALLTGALPGVLYLYQGDELGLPEVEDLPIDVRTDPMHLRSGGIDPGRDGCRVPLPWRTLGTSLGFSPTSSTSEAWLPQPADWSALSVEAQLADPYSMLALYRGMLRLRRTEPALRDGAFDWLTLPDEPANILAFSRGQQLRCLVNFGGPPYPLAVDADVLLASDPLDGGRLPPDTAVWLRE